MPNRSSFYFTESGSRMFFPKWRGAGLTGHLLAVGSVLTEDLAAITERPLT